MPRHDAPRPAPAAWALVAGLALGFAAGRSLGATEHVGCAATPDAHDTTTDASPTAEVSTTTTTTPAPVMAPTPEAPVPPGEPWLPLRRHNARRGTTGAKATVVEIVDFTSTDCKAVAPLLHRVRERYPTEVAVVVVHGPRSPEARGAALAMQAALRQRKHWEMHDRMLEPGAALAREDLLAHAADLGLDVEQFGRDLDDPGVAAEVDADLAVVARVGATSAPAFFINCIALAPPHDLDAFARAIEPQIAAADAHVAAGTTLEGLYEVMCAPP